MPGFSGSVWNLQTRIIMTGGTGNTGGLVAKKLVEQGISRDIVALVRTSSDTSDLRELGVKIHACDLNDPSSFTIVVTPNSLFVETANLRHADRMLLHLIEAGISQAFCVTTTAVYSSYHSYVQLYREIEARLLSQSIPVALLWPSMIYGNERDHNMHRLISFMSRSPVFPVFGSGTALMQPVYVDDLAEGIVTAVRQRARGPFNLACPEPLTYNELIYEVAAALGKNVRLIHINHGLVSRLVKMMERMPKFPVKHEQVMRLLEDKTFDIGESRKVLNYRPRSFSEGIREEVKRIGIRQW